VFSTFSIALPFIFAALALATSPIPLARFDAVPFAIILIAIKDVFFNKEHTIKHNFPVVGHFRYILESIGPELRQYIVANNREELPFNRIERGWIYASAKNENNYEGFGTDQDIFQNNYIFVKNTMIPYRLPENHINKEDP